MESCAFVSLDDISAALPPYREEVISVPLEEPLKSAYQELEEEISACVKQHRSNRSVLGTMLNALLRYRIIPTVLARSTVPNTTRKADSGSGSSLQRPSIWTNTRAMRKSRR